MLGQKAALWQCVDGAMTYSGYPCSPWMPWEGVVVGSDADSPRVRTSDLDGGIAVPSPARVFGSLPGEVGVVVVEGDAGVEGARRGREGMGATSARLETAGIGFGWRRIWGSLGLWRCWGLRA